MIPYSRLFHTHSRRPPFTHIYIEVPRHSRKLRTQWETIIFFHGNFIILLDKRFRKSAWLTWKITQTGRQEDFCPRYVSLFRLLYELHIISISQYGWFAWVHYRTVRHALDFKGCLGCVCKMPDIGNFHCFLRWSCRIQLQLPSCCVEQGTILGISNSWTRQVCQKTCSPWLNSSSSFGIEKIVCKKESFRVLHLTGVDQE